MGFFTSLILLVITTVLAELLRPKPNIENARPRGLGDFDFPTATEGRVVPIVFGRVMLQAPNVVWFGDFTAAPIKEKIKTGLWSSETITKGFHYYAGMQGALCRGPIDAIHAFYIGEEEVWTGTTTSSITVDKPDLFGGDNQGSGGVSILLDIYPGSTTQTANTYLGGFQDAGAGTDRTPAYRGTCYFVARNPGTTPSVSEGTGAYLGNQTTIKPWKFEVSRYPALFGTQGAGENKINTDDANPVNVLYEVLTNTEWGLGFNSGDIDLAGFETAADTCITEGLGFSMALTGKMTAKDLIGELERHMDGVLFLDKSTGIWKIKLARADYVLANVPALTVDNVIAVEDFTQGSWNETANRVDVKFAHRDNQYKDTYATSSDSANFQIQGGGTVGTGVNVVAEVNYPGIMNPTTAATIAWRELRTRSYPLARATFIVNREFWDLNIGDPISWTDSKYGFNQLAMRVTELDFGELGKNQIKVKAVQDIFRYVAPSFAAPPATSGESAFQSPVVYPSAEQFAEEAPRRLAELEPDFPGDHTVSRVVVGIVREGREQGFNLYERSYSGSPSGSFALNKENQATFTAIGKLSKAIDVLGDPGQPTNSDATTTIQVVADASTAADILNWFQPDGATATDEEMGENLAHLIRINNEYILVDSVAESGGTVTMTGPNRGVLDSVQAEHAVDDKVYMYTGGVVALSKSYTNTHTVEVNPRMVSLRGDEFAGTPNTLTVNLDKRALRPYPPAGVIYNSDANAYGTTPDFRDAGTTYDDYEMNLDARRRDYLAYNEITALTTDDTGIDASTEYQLDIVADPDGGADSVFSSSWQTSNTFTGILKRFYLNVAAAGTECETRINTRHDIGSETNLEARSKLTHRFTPVTDFDGTTHLGASVPVSTATNSFTAEATANYTFYSSKAVTSGQVEYRVNGGSWTLGMNTGTSFTKKYNANDIVEFRRTVDYGNAVIHVEDVSTNPVAHGTFRL